MGLPRRRLHPQQGQRRHQAGDRHALAFDQDMQPAIVEPTPFPDQLDQPAVQPGRLGPELIVPQRVSFGRGRHDRRVAGIHRALAAVQRRAAVRMPAPEPLGGERIEGRIRGGPPVQADLAGGLGLAPGGQVRRRRRGQVDRLVSAGEYRGQEVGGGVVAVQRAVAVLVVGDPQAAGQRQGVGEVVGPLAVERRLVVLPLADVAGVVAARAKAVQRRRQAADAHGAQIGLRGEPHH